MKHTHRNRSASRLSEILFYSASALLALVALATPDGALRYLSLSIVVIGQSIYGLRHHYRGQAVVYLMATYLLLDILRPLNIPILQSHPLLLTAYCLSIYASSAVVARYGFALEFLGTKTGARKTGAIAVFVLLLLYLVFSTSSSIFLPGHRILITGRSLFSIALIALWFIPWIGCAFKVFDEVKNLISGTSSSTALDFLSFFAMGSAAGLAYLFLYRPGLMSPDSYVQWRQAVGILPLSDWHPYLHTLIIRMLVAVYRSPIMLPLLQIALSALVYAAWGNFLLQRGARRTYMYILIAFFSIAPLHALLNISLWKDVLYTLALTFLTLQCARIVVYKENYFTRIGNNASFAVSTVLVWSIRHNGFIVGIVALSAVGVYLISCLRCTARTCTRAAVNSGAVIILVLASEVVILEALPRALSVLPNQAAAGYTTFLSPLGALARDGVYSRLPLEGADAETLALMERVMPLEAWKRQYQKYTVFKYLCDNDGAFVRNASALRASEVLRVYWMNLLKYPAHVAADRINKTSILWNITDTDFAIDSIVYSYLSDMKDYGIPAHTCAAGQWIFKGLQKYNDLLFRLGSYSLILTLLLGYVVLTGHFRLSFVYIPMLANTASLMLSMPSPEYRFGHYLLEVFPFVLTFILVEIRNEEYAGSPAIGVHPPRTVTP